MTAYYNEIDPFAAAWLRELIKAGQIAPGDVDTRSIEDVTPADLRSYTQCHFFAGIGVWSYALRSAGWPDDRPIWTGSCPCQPFSAAGKGAGFDDERHLWPAWFWLIDQCRPAIVIGEQVASKDANAWIDLVQTDLEAVGYGVGAVPFAAASVGAPHIRDRTYWVADAQGDGHERRGELGEPAGRDGAAHSLSDGRLAHANGAVSKLTARSGARPGQAQGAGAHGEPDGRSTVRGLAAVGLGDRLGAGLEGHSRDGYDRDEPGRVGADATGSAAATSDIGGVGNALGAASERDTRSVSRAEAQEHGARVAVDGRGSIGPEHASAGVGRVADRGRPGPTNGFWRAADWLFCRDGKWRPVEPGTFPLAHGSAARVGRLRGYGNAINAVQATVFVEEVIGLMED